MTENPNEPVPQHVWEKWQHIGVQWGKVRAWQRMRAVMNGH